MRRAVAVVALPVVLAASACGSSQAPSRSAPRLPAGIADASTGVLYAARVDAASGRTRVSALATSTGRRLHAATLRGRWVIPAVAGDDLAGSLSGDGRALALAGPSGEGTSAFALLDTRLARPPRAFTLHGRWSFDALSPDGRVVYLIQHARTGHYRVRAYDVALRRLRPGAIVEKGESGPDMIGRPVARQVAPGGSPVYTLYRRGAAGAFVHALHTDNGIAVCVDLPPRGAWRLAWSSDGARLFAVDRTHGRRVRVDS
jgi:hypothetical protein